MAWSCPKNAIEFKRPFPSLNEYILLQKDKISLVPVDGLI